jgi:hypothetical protein
LTYAATAVTASRLFGWIGDQIWIGDQAKGVAQS